MVPRQAIRRCRGSATLLGLLTVLGCGGDANVAPFQPATGADAASLYWTLTLDQTAITLSTFAPYDTLQLIATPRDAHGNAVQGLGTVMFTSADTARVSVSPTGLVRALAPASDIIVVAELVAGNVRHTVNLAINVVSDSAPPILAHLSIHPAPPDSTRWAIGGDGSGLVIGYGQSSAFDFKIFAPPALTDTAGNLIPGLLVVCRSTDVTVVQVLCQPSLFLGVIPYRPGRVNLIATATAFGITKADTVEFTVTLPTYAVVWLRKMPGALGTTVIGLDAPDVTIRRGGSVIWGNLTGQMADILFDNPSAVAEHGVVSCANAGVTDPGGAGNIVPFGVAQTSTDGLSADNCRSRRFPATGVYPYHSPLTGAAGSVIVTD